MQLLKWLPPLFLPLFIVVELRFALQCSVKKVSNNSVRSVTLLDSVSSVSFFSSFHKEFSSNPICDSILFFLMVASFTVGKLRIFALAYKVNL